MNHEVLFLLHQSVAQWFAAFPDIERSLPVIPWNINMNQGNRF